MSSVEDSGGSAGEWRAIFADVEIFRDSCNVYAVAGERGTLFVNAGNGAWLDRLPDRFRPPYTLLCTHYFRDHAAAASKAARAGMTVFVPEGDKDIFADPVQHFRARENYIVYDNIWDTFVPIEPTEAIAAADYAILRIAGLDVEVIPLPGVTPHHTGFGLTGPRSGKRLVFAGEAIHSPGRMARVAPLQYDYNDLGGAVNAYYSAGVLQARPCDALLPSLGEPIIENHADALGALRRSLKSLCANRPLERALIESVDDDRLERVTDHAWMSLRSEAVSWVLISEAGKALVIDYGYRGGFGGSPPPVPGKNWPWPSYPTRARRRPLLHTLAALKRQFGIDRIDVALIGHFHDDHVAGVPMLQRLLGTQCWVPENFARLLAQPDGHRWPCNWPQAVRIDRTLPFDEPFRWQEFAFRLAPMSGHTRFSAAIYFEADGRRFAHTGDQYFFQERARGDNRDDWSRADVLENQVYRNGADLDSFRRSAAVLDAWRPDIVLTGHQRAMITDEAFFAKLSAFGERFVAMHAAAAALRDDEAHFGVDGFAGAIWPYRTHVAAADVVVDVEVTVRNPLGRAATLSVSLVGPDGWRGSATQIDAEARAEVTCRLSIRPAGPCRRQPIAAAVSIGGRSFGQVAEALVTVGGTCF